MIKSPASRSVKYVVLCSAAVWRIVLIGILYSNGGFEFGAAALLFTIGLLPYVVLLLLMPHIDKRIWFGALMIVGLFDIISGVGAILPKSSTDVIGIGLVPVYDIFLVVPGAWLIGNALPRLIRRLRRR